MTETNALPWEEDEIEFLPGNWQIERGSMPGTYRYEKDGIRAQREVDAVQLIDWDMARLRVYEALSPWQYSGITFAPEREILRDVADNTGVERERQYYLYEGDELVRANKFYLVQQGYAEGNADFVAQVRAVKLKGKKELQAVPWDSDDIVLVARPGWKVERAVNEGRYRVAHDSMTLNWTASRLIDEGLAKPSYALKLDKQSEKKASPWREFCAQTHDFWMTVGTPDEPKDLRGVARLWQKLCSDPLCDAVRRIDAYHRDIVARRGDETRREQAVQDALDEAERKRVAVAAMTVEAADIRNRCAAYAIKDIDASDADFDALDLLFQAKAANARRLITEGVAALDGICIGGESAETLPTPFPIEILPPSAQSALQSSYTAAHACLASPSPMSMYNSDIAGARLQLKTLEPQISLLEKSVATARTAVQTRIRRRGELDAIKRKLPAKLLQKKPPLLQFPHKSDRIKFTTGIKIKKRQTGGYQILTDSGVKYLSAHELIYMGLAKSI